MPWQDILASGAARAGLRSLRAGGHIGQVISVLENHFPEEDSRNIREAAQRIVDSYRAGSMLNRPRRDRALDANDAPWIAGRGIRPQDSPDCRWRYDVTLTYTDSDTGADVVRDVRQIDADHNLTVSELRALADDAFREWAGRNDTLRGGAGDSGLTFKSMRVNFVFRC